jgi:hypothetical protein
MTTTLDATRALQRKKNTLATWLRASGDYHSGDLYAYEAAKRFIDRLCSTTETSSADRDELILQTTKYLGV